MKLIKKVFIALSLILILTSCQSKNNENKSDEETKTDESTKVETDKSSIRPETAEILKGMNEFKSEVLFNHSNKPKEESIYEDGPYANEVFALAELMVRADHAKSYDFTMKLKESTEKDVVFPIISNKEDYVKALSRLNNEDLYKKYPKLVIARYKNFSPIGVYESIEKAPENPILSFEIYDFSTSDNNEKPHFPYFPKLARGYTISYQYQPKDVEEHFSVDNALSWKSEQKIYLNNEEVANMDTVNSDSRKVYEGTYEIKIDWIDVKTLKIGKPDAKGYEFNNVVPADGKQFTGVLRIGDQGKINEGDLQLSGVNLEDYHAGDNNINIMNGLISVGDTVMSIEKSHELVQDLIDKKLKN